MNIALVLVHNKSSKENFDQIETIKPLVTLLTDTYNSINEAGKKETYTTYHYELKNLGFPHSLKIYQIIPFGVTPPINLYDLDSYKVFYGKGDEDMVGDHPHFFNWGLKRATDYGAEAVIHMDDAKSFTIKDLPFYLTSLANPLEKTEFIQDDNMKISTLKLLRQIGQIDEKKSIIQAVDEMKVDLIDVGLEAIDMATVQEELKN